MLLIEMDMPKNCIFCPMSHWNKLDEWTGCDAVGGKRFAATTDNEYSKMEGRPDWCPIKADTTQILRDAFERCYGENGTQRWDKNPDIKVFKETEDEA